MIVGVTGTTRGGTLVQQSALTSLLRSYRIAEMHHGEAVGIDEYAHLAVQAAGTGGRLIGHPPDEDSRRAFLEGYYEERDPAPYLVRDQQMVDEISLLIAVPETDVEVLRSGTWATVRYAREARIMIIRINPDGSVALG